MKQKTIGAVDSGADLLIVPVGNAAEARRYAGSLKVVGVRTFDQALRAMCDVLRTSETSVEHVVIVVYDPDRSEDARNLLTS